MKKPYIVFNRTFNKNTLNNIYNDYIEKSLSVGIDGINNKVFKNKVELEIDLILKKVFDETYNFSFYKEKLISKGKGKYPRVISIPTNRDKLVLKAMSIFLTEIYETEREEELVHTKIAKIKSDIEIKKYNTFIKIDIENFYPSINHSKLISFLKKKTKKKQFSSLLEKAITQNTLNKSSKFLDKYTSTEGVPQGLSISNILANIYFLEIDKIYSNAENFSYFRYVDDILILCNEENSIGIYENIKRDIEKLNLKIHPLIENSQKTSKGLIYNSFYFLGYKFSDILISTREESFNSICNSLINIFTQYKHSSHKDLDILYWKVNLRITGCKLDDKKFGWLFFFSQINDLVLLFKLDKFVENLCKKFSVTYIGKVKKFNRTYYEIMKNRSNTKYIPNFSNYTTEMKKEILKNIFKIETITFYSDDAIENKFDFIIHKNIKAMEKDIQIGS